MENNLLNLESIKFQILFVFSSIVVCKRVVASFDISKKKFWIENQKKNIETTITSTIYCVNVD